MDLKVRLALCPRLWLLLQKHSNILEQALFAQLVLRVMPQ